MSNTALEAFLVRSGLARPGAPQRWVPLSGGVSSEIWRVELEDASAVCVKRALARLKVAADWQAPVSRNAHEWGWMQFASRVAAHAVPAPLAHDEQAGLFAMAWLEPDRHPVWKEQLMAGEVSCGTAREVGRVLGCIHAASAERDDIRAAFDTTSTFHALRLEPYLLHTARAHPALAPSLLALAERTADTRRALVHGDVSPKNILVGPQGPVLLDAECAWFGDPAFDLAFCLNHLLLKSIPRPEAASRLHGAFLALVSGYLGAAGRAADSGLQARAASLLPALLLARVDGKSPAEYIQTEEARARVRACAIPLISDPKQSLAELAARAFPALSR